MLQRILGTHPAIHTVPETWLMLHPIYALKQDGVVAEYEAPVARHALRGFMTQIEGGEESYVAGLRDMAASLYGKALEPSGKALFLDKTPRYFHIVPELRRVFPNAKIILLLRNPLAVLSSVLGTWFGKDLKTFEASYNYQDMMRGPQLLAEAKEALGDQAFVLSYEKLVTDTEPCLRVLCEWLDVPFVPEMVDYGSSCVPRSEFGDQTSVFKHGRPVHDYLDTWTRELVAGNLADFARAYLKSLGPELIGKLGYSFDALQAGLQADPASGTADTDKSQNLDALNRRGESLAEEGNLDEAMKLFRKGLEIDPEHAEICNNLGVLHWQQGDTNETLEFLGKAYAADSDRRETVMNLGFVLSELGLTQDAKLVLHGYLKNHAGDEELQHLLAALVTEAGNDALEAAIQDSQCSTTREVPDDPPCEEPVGTRKAGRDRGATAIDGGRSNPEVRRSADPTFGRAQGSPYLVSAIVSAYNAERFLRGCLEDLENQTIADRLQIIVVDSGSEQNEFSIVKEFQNRYPNIEYIRSARRETVYAAWNRGIVAASGQYITNANADDRHREDAFERMVEVLEGNEDIALVYADAAVSTKENEAFDSADVIGHFRWPDFEPRRLFEVCYVGPQPMWRGDLHERYGYFDVEFQSAGDYEYWLRLCSNETFQHISDVLGLYLYSPASVEHRDQVVSARESAIARQRYWPAAWGGVPQPRGNFFVASDKTNCAAG